MTAFRSLARAAAAALVVAASALPALAQPAVLDFAAFRRPTTTEFQAVPGGDVYEDGFGVFASFGSGARNALSTWGTDPAAERPDLYANVPSNLGPTAAALYGTQFGEQINVFREDGRLFDLLSIDLAHEYSNSYLVSGDLAEVTVTFFGFDRNFIQQPSLVQSFVIPVPPAVGGVRTPLLSTFRFNANWRAISEFAWFQGNGSATSHQFTNIGVNVIPEPGTYALLGLGLAGVAVVVRRRRVA